MGADKIFHQEFLRAKLNVSQFIPSVTQKVIQIPNIRYTTSKLMILKCISCKL